MKLFESSEDYLERILMLQERKGNVRAIDIANDMNYSKPSVSVAVHKLEDNGYINIDQNGIITLTDLGASIANKIYERHKLLTNLLEQIGVSSEQAHIDACKIEHTLSDETFDALKRYINR